MPRETVGRLTRRGGVWSGEVLRPSAVLVDRRGGLVRARGDKNGLIALTQQLSSFDSMMTHAPIPA